jgi:hypothetical protein
VREAVVAVAVWLAATWLVQLALVLAYRAASHRPRAPLPARLPRIGVVMPVRGLDPELPAALASLLAASRPGDLVLVLVHVDPAVDALLATAAP